MPSRDGAGSAGGGGGQPRGRKLEELDGGVEGEREEERTSNVVPLGRSIAGFRRGTRPATLRRRHRAVPRGTNRSGVLAPVRRAGGRVQPLYTDADGEE